MTYLLFGGAFNPPTKAHIELAEYACRQTAAEQVIFMPTKMTYIEGDQAKDFAFKDEQRYQMLQKICHVRKLLRVSDYELKQPVQPRTYQTLCYLKRQGYTCRLLFGSDKLPELKNGWKHVREIAEEFGIVCMARYGDDCEKMIAEDSYLSGLKEYIQVLSTPPRYHQVSSTAIRRQYMEIKQAMHALKQNLPTELNGLREYLLDEDKL